MKIVKNVILNFQKLTKYKISDQPSNVIHWKTVNIARNILSNDVMPLFGPGHLLGSFLHISPPGQCLPQPLPGSHGRGTINLSDNVTEKKRKIE